MSGHTGSADFNLWPTRRKRPEPLSDQPTPTEEERAEWREVAENEEAPDRFRAICAMALLYDGRKELATTSEVAEQLGWPLERTKTALEAAVEAGWTTRMRDGK